MTYYPDNWKEIALAIKEEAGWQCSKCGMQCIRPGEDTAGLTYSERMARTLQVHHWNRDPGDNRPENLSALCSGCHLSYHYLGQSNVSRPAVVPVLRAKARSAKRSDEVSRSLKQRSPSWSSVRPAYSFPSHQRKTLP